MEQKFSHITVGSVDDDEVIVAGVTEQTPVHVAPDAPALERSVAPEPEPQQKVEETSSAKPQAKKAMKDEYQETTLEDLEGYKAPLAQKLVIVFAILLIVGFAAYWFFLR